MTIASCIPTRAIASIQGATRSQFKPSRSSILRAHEADVHETSAPTLDALLNTRRTTLALLAATLALPGTATLPALAEAAPGFETFYGAATPPTSYGGYGGNADEDAKYTFEYPSGWKPAVPNKVEKGTQGIDCRVSNPRNKNQTITVVTFGRAGEDNKSFKLTDIETTVQGFAGADYDLQDAIALETGRKNEQREFNGEPYYDIQIDSPDVTYLITVTVNYGKVFALFVKSPTKLFAQDEEKLRRIQETFRTL